MTTTPSCYIIIYMLNHDPFLPLSSSGLDQSWLDANKSSLLAALADNKYWTNTILPLVRSGHMAALIRDQYVYPHRVGLFPGLSCMFYCGFCGRNKNAAYDRMLVDAGIDIYKNLMADAPHDGDHWKDRFRISGGQEPLTNPRIGELVSYGASLGLRMGMYTNAYMLTTSFMNKQPGMFNLDYLRVSLYGYDDHSYDMTTKRANSWKIVRNNLVNWAKLDGTQDIRIGVNWIILPGKSHDYMRFLKAMSDLQDDMGRALDFITVREDFSQDLVYINDEERHQLSGIMLEADKLVATSMPNTKIDYGYALEPLRQGKIAGPLKMAKYNQLDAKGLAQASVQVDIAGNVYAYHETAFLDRPGSDRFIIGNAKDGMEAVIKSHLTNGNLEYIPSDTEMLDAFDHAVSLAVWAAKQDVANGFSTTLWQ